MDLHQRNHPDQSRHIVHSPVAEGRVRVVTAVQGDHKPLEEEARVLGGPWGSRDLRDSNP